MKLAIGVGDDEATTDAIALGAAIARTFPEVDPAAVHVYNNHHQYIARAGVDFDWEAYSEEQADRIVNRSATEMNEKFGVSGCGTGITGHRSSGHGLTDFAHDQDSDWIVIGSAPGGSLDRFTIGSTANQLLHGASTPIVLAPMGFRRRDVTKLDRVVVALGSGEEGKRTLRTAAKFAQSSGLPLVVLTIVLHNRMSLAGLPKNIDRELLEDAVNSARATQAEALTDSDLADLPIDHEVLEGDTVSDAISRMDWNGGDLLLVPSSRGILRRVFLGDMNYKIVRATRVPTLVLPRLTD